MTQRLLCAVFALFAVFATVPGCQNTSGAPSGPRTSPPVGFVKRSVMDSSGVWGYQVAVPLNYDQTRKWPVILFLHGSGQAGTDNEKQTQFGLGPVVRARLQDFPAIVVFPQAPMHTGWWGPGARVAVEALDSTVREWNGDPTREYLTGLSLGGYGTWEIALEQAGRFAALVPIASGINTHCTRPGCQKLIPAIPPAVPDPYLYVAQQLRSIPVWVFHGGSDPIVPVSEPRNLVAALERVGAPVHYTEYPGVGHDAWDAAYADPATWNWLLAQHKGQ